MHFPKLTPALDNVITGAMRAHRLLYHKKHGLLFNKPHYPRHASGPRVGQWALFSVHIVYLVTLASISCILENILLKHLRILTVTYVLYHVMIRASIYLNRLNCGSCHNFKLSDIFYYFHLGYANSAVQRERLQITHEIRQRVNLYIDQTYHNIDASVCHGRRVWPLSRHSCATSRARPR